MAADLGAVTAVEVTVSSIRVHKSGEGGGWITVATPNRTIDLLPGLLEFHSAVLVTERGKVQGIITKANLLRVKVKSPVRIGHLDL